jgi:hypothetical protein
VTDKNYIAEGGDAFRAFMVDPDPFSCKDNNPYPHDSKAYQEWDIGFEAAFDAYHDEWIGD